MAFKRKWQEGNYTATNSVENKQRKSGVVHLRLDGGKRYAHTASCNYQINMASLQPDDRNQPSCACSQINKGGNNLETDDKVVVIVEHDLKENILCILDSKRVHQCKLDLKIQSGEQIAFRTIGKIPVQLSGVSSRAH